MKKNKVSYSRFVCFRTFLQFLIEWNVIFLVPYIYTYIYVCVCVCVSRSWGHHYGGFAVVGKISLETSNTNIFFGLVTLAETEWRKE